jgi:hypothetical protein
MSKRLGLLVAALAATVALTGGARADRLDGQLNGQMDGVVAGLKKKYKSVGVLRFRVQDGSKGETFDSPLSGRMQERIATLLMIHNGPDESKALGLVRDVEKVAGKNRVGAWFSSAAQRRKLFELSYPMAWGSRRVMPDAFVTGKVALSKDRKKTTVTLEAFDRDAPGELRQLAKLTMDTDRFVLRDLGYSFALTKQAKERLVARRSMHDEDANFIEVVEEQSKQDEKGKAQPKKPGETRAEPASVAGVQVQLLVRGEPVAIRRSASQSDAIRWQVDCPPPGSEVAIRLRNTSSKRLAVVLRLNGVSTINEQRDDPEAAAKWVIPAGRSYLIKGFYMVEADGAEKRGKASKRGDEGGTIDEGEKQKEKQKDGEQQIKPFSVLSGDAARAAVAELGEKKGLIEVDVFEEGPGGDETEMFISPKGLPPSKEKQARSSYLGLRSALLKSSKLTSTVETKKEGTLVVKREIIVPDASLIAAEEKLRLVAFPGARLASRIAIKVMPGEGSAASTFGD